MIFVVMRKDGKKVDKMNKNRMRGNGKKQSVNLRALQDAVEDGRIDIWVNQDGEIVVENKRTHNSITVLPTKNMWGESDE